MLRRSGFKWLRRGGFLALAFVTLGLLAWVIWDDLEIREYSRSTDGPLVAHREARAYSQIFNALPLAAKADADLRIFVMPQLRRHAFAVSITGDAAGGGQGFLTVVKEQDDGHLDASPPLHFYIEPARYTLFKTQADHLIYTNRGYGFLCFDGVEIAFERRRGSRLVSGVGNDCDTRHYGPLGALVLSEVRYALPDEAPGLGWSLERPGR